MTDIKEKTTTWYTVKVQANRERSVAERLKLEAQKEGLKNLKQILVPLEKTFYIKEGKKMSRDKIIYPGYAFIEVDSIGEVEYILKKIGGNSGLLKDRSGTPLPIKESEINRMIGQIEVQKTQADDKFMINETVNIKSGPFSGFKGVIEELHHDKNKVRLAVSIFGRLTQMDLEFNQIDKINE